MQGVNLLRRKLGGGFGRVDGKRPDLPDLAIMGDGEFGAFGRDGPSDCTAAENDFSAGVEVSHRCWGLKISDGIEDGLLVLVLILVLVLVFILTFIFVFVFVVRAVIRVQLILFAEFGEFFGGALAAAVEDSDLRVL